MLIYKFKVAVDATRTRITHLPVFVLAAPFNLQLSSRLILVSLTAHCVANRNFIKTRGTSYTAFY